MHPLRAQLHFNETLISFDDDVDRAIPRSARMIDIVRLSNDLLAPTIFYSLPYPINVGDVVVTDDDPTAANVTHA